MISSEKKKKNWLLLLSPKQELTIKHFNFSVAANNHKSSRVYVSEKFLADHDSDGPWWHYNFQFNI